MSETNGSNGDIPKNSSVNGDGQATSHSAQFIPDILSKDEHPGVRGGIRLAAQAIREEWPVSEGCRAIIMERAMELVENPENDRVFVNAAKLVLAADSINVRREKTAIDAEQGQVANHISALRLRIMKGAGVTVEGQKPQVQSIQQDSAPRATDSQSVTQQHKSNVTHEGGDIYALLD